MTKDKKILFCSTFVAFIALSSFSVLTITVYFSGKVHSADKRIKERVQDFIIQVKADNKVLVQTPVDKVGHYDLSFFPDKQQSFDFYVTGISVEPLLVKSYTVFPSDDVTLDIELPIKYKKQNGKAVCPKCNKADKVYPIAYMDPLIVKQTIVNGDTIVSNIVNGKYNAVSCFDKTIAPKWYCDKDKIKY